MALLFNVVFAWKSSSTHHKLALEALCHLRGENAEQWGNCFLSQVDAYLRGAKAPDTEFKDFTNHVLHVRENYWGGAVKAASDWYQHTVAALRQQQWGEAIYAAGVLSHYYTDPLMPFHTGQTEEEGIVHRALEWSVAKSYEQLRDLLEHELGGTPTVEVPAGADWLAQMVRQGAELSNQHYEALIDHYDLKTGVKDPPAGLDRECRVRLAPLLGHAAVGLARILERAFQEAGVQPPQVNLTLAGLLATLNIPIQWVTKKLADVKERAVVTAIYQEYQQTGKVIQALPEDDRLVRQSHAAEVLRVPLATLDAQLPRLVGAKHGSAPTPAPAPLRLATRPKEEAKKEPIQPPMRTPRIHLSPEMPVEEAPSVGPKTAERLLQINVRTVAELLKLVPEEAAYRLAARHITAATIADWQAQARLMCNVPGLRCHDVQILVGAEVRDRQQLASSSPATLLARVQQFLSTTAGERVLRGGTKPDLEEVTRWISNASQGGQAKAA